MVISLIFRIAKVAVSLPINTNRKQIVNPVFHHPTRRRAPLYRHQVRPTGKDKALQQCKSAGMSAFRSANERDYRAFPGAMRFSCPNSVWVIIVSAVPTLRGEKILCL
jgi:hypothetical protein